MDAPQTPSPAEVLLKLQELTRGLYYPSEGDYPFEIIQYNAVASVKLTTPEVLAITGNQPETQVEIIELTTFFRNITQPATAPEKENSLAKRFLTLQLFLEQHLPEVKVYRLGRRTIHAYILGRLPTGNVVGLKTTVIET